MAHCVSKVVQEEGSYIYLSTWSHLRQVHIIVPAYQELLKTKHSKMRLPNLELNGILDTFLKGS